MNPLRSDEQLAGPAVGYESKLEQKINNGGNPTVIEHEQTLLNDTGPRRIGENKNDRKRKRKNR